MRPARDSFLHYVADNLTGISVHPIRNDAAEPEASVLQENAVNIEFTDIQPTNLIYTQQVVFDVLNDSENTAVDWVAALWQLLNAAYMAPMSDYTDPASPVSLNRNVFWLPKRIAFKKISSGHYCHFNCVMTIWYS